MLEKKVYRYQLVNREEILQSIKSVYPASQIIPYIEQSKEVLVSVVDSENPIRFDFVDPETGEIMNLEEGRHVCLWYQEKTYNLTWSSKVFVKYIGPWEEHTNETTASTTTAHQHTCPICKSDGDDLAFAFYCSNQDCDNYHP